MDFKFEPESVADGSMTGHVVIRTPGFEDKMHFYHAIGVQSDGIGEAGKSPWIAMAKMAAEAKKYVKEVALVRVSDGFKFDSYESLDADEDGHMVIQEIIAKVSSKMHLGKRLPSS